jgi:hypothetical protein
VDPVATPTALVIWAQRAPGWTQEQADAWRKEVAAFVAALREFGVDAKVDLHYLSQRGVDWTRFGPKAIVESQWVIVALSPAWRDRWEGVNAPTVGAGAAAEADVLRSVFAANQQEFRDKLVLVTLRSMADEPDLVPTGLHGVQRRTVLGFGLPEMADLIRLLTGQDAFPAAPLGDVPRLPPAVPGSGRITSADPPLPSEEPQAPAATSEGRAQASVPTSDPSSTSAARHRATRVTRRGLRLAVLGFALTLAGVYAIAVAVSPGDTQHPHKAKSEPKRPAPTIDVADLTPAAVHRTTITIRGINRTYRPRWGTDVVADATDTLTFEARAENHTQRPIGPLVLLIACTTFCTGSSSESLSLRTAVVDARGAVYAVSDRVAIHAQSGGLQRFVLDAERGLSEVFDDGIGTSSELTRWKGKVRIPPAEGRVVGAFNIGKLGAGEVRRLRFNATWDVGNAGQLAAGASMVRVGHGKWVDHLSVSPGQVVTVGTRLDNAAYSHPWTARVHVAFKPDVAAGTVDVITNATLAKGHDQGGIQPTGKVTLRSSGTGPIGLDFVPGTTRLLGKCRPEACKKGGDKLRLPDGLADAGIDVGPLGGFVPRDPESGVQFARILTFGVKVKALRSP